MSKSLKAKDILTKIETSLRGIYDQNEISGISGLIWEDILGLSKLDRISNSEIRLSNETYQAFVSCLQRLKKHEPIQQIIGFVEFYGRNFKVNRNVLIPRPETEELCHQIINDLKTEGRSLNIIDIGTGSGCIATTLSKELRQLKVYASDISSKALEIAQQNAKELKADVQFIQDDISDSNINRQFQVIVSNPPYVTLSEKGGMKKNVLHFEPHEALFAPENDPIFFYRKIRDFSIDHLDKNGRVYLEINHQFHQETLDLFLNADFHQAKLIRSLNGHYRFLSCIKR